MAGAGGDLGATEDPTDVFLRKIFWVFVSVVLAFEVEGFEVEDFLVLGVRGGFEGTDEGG